MPKWFRLRYAYLLLSALFVSTLAYSVYIYDDTFHSHSEMHAGEVFERDDVVIDFYKSMNRHGREKVVCYRESHKNFYIFTFQLVVFILVVTAYAGFTKVRLSGRLKKQNAAIQLQKDELDRKNQAILSSIRYAQRVQNAMLPTSNELKATIGEHILYFRAKDIVSGDFYWSGENRHGSFMCVADCTGHGVPGAFLASIGANTLTQVLSNEIDKPSQLIKKLNQAFHNFLSNNHADDAYADGMEISCLMIDADTGAVTFAGARGRATVVSPSGLVNEYRGDEHTIGHTFKAEFINRSIRVEPSSWVYLYTDGITDQFGGVAGKKLQRSGLRSWLQSYNHLAVAERNVKIAAAIETWKINQPQIDDMLFVGFQMDQTPAAIDATTFQLPSVPLLAV